MVNERCFSSIGDCDCFECGSLVIFLMAYSKSNEISSAIFHFLFIKALLAETAGDSIKTEKREFAVIMIVPLIWVRMCLQRSAMYANW